MNITLPKLIKHIKERLSSDLLLHASLEHQKTKNSFLKYFKISSFALFTGIIAGFFLRMPDLPKIIDFPLFLLTFLSGIGGFTGIIISFIGLATLKVEYNKIFNINLENKEQLFTKFEELNTEEAKKEFEELFKLSKFSNHLKQEEIQSLMNVDLNKAQVAYVKNIIVHNDSMNFKDLEALSRLSSTVKINAFLEDNQIQNSLVGKMLMQENDEQEIEVEYNKFL